MLLFRATRDKFFLGPPKMDQKIDGITQNDDSSSLGTFAYFCPPFSAPGPAGARQQPVQPGLAMNRRGSSVKAVGRWFLTWEWLESLLIVRVLSRFVLYDTFDNTLFKLLGSGNLLIPLWPWFLLLRTQALARSNLKINAHLWGPGIHRDFPKSSRHAEPTNRTLMSI